MVFVLLVTGNGLLDVTQIPKITSIVPIFLPNDLTSILVVSWNHFKSGRCHIPFPSSPRTFVLPLVVIVVNRMRWSHHLHKCHGSRPNFVSIDADAGIQIRNITFEPTPTTKNFHCIFESVSSKSLG